MKIKLIDFIGSFNAATHASDAAMRECLADAMDNWDTSYGSLEEEYSIGFLVTELLTSVIEHHDRLVQHLEEENLGLESQLDDLHARLDRIHSISDERG